MGHISLKDQTISQRCLADDLGDRRWLGDDTDVTVLEIGARKPLAEHRYSDYSKSRLSSISQEYQDGPDPSCTELPSAEHISLKLFFLTSRDDNCSKASPSCNTPPDIISFFQERFQLGESTALRTHHDDDGPVSPTASPRCSDGVASSTGHGVALQFAEELEMIKRQPHQGRYFRDWIWETRYIRSTIYVLADAQTTIYFCTGFSDKLRRRITDTMRSMEALAKSPLFMDTLIIDEVIGAYRDAIKAQRSRLLALNNDDSNDTEMTIRLEELAAKWRTILADIRGIRAHVRELQELVQSRIVHHQTRESSPRGRASCYQHTRQQSSEVFGPRAAEILELQHSTCEFWARCVNMYLQRTTDRANKNSTYHLRKTIPLRRRGSMPEINRRLSNFTIDIAVQVQRNSASVSTLAVSFLSTIFFSPDGLLLAITYWWWILATLIVPLTFIIIHLWFETLARNTSFLRRRKAQQEQQEQQQQQQLNGIAEDEMD